MYFRRLKNNWSYYEVKSMVIGQKYLNNVFNKHFEATTFRGNKTAIYSLPTHAFSTWYLLCSSKFNNSICCLIKILKYALIINYSGFRKVLSLNYLESVYDSISNPWQIEHLLWRIGKSLCCVFFPKSPSNNLTGVCMWYLKFPKWQRP